jgi:hypothetical protein
MHVLPAAATEVIGEINRATCTIIKIDGPVVETSCKPFVLGEDITITDAAGREIFVYEIPLPCSAVISYQCLSKKDCATIVTIELLQKIAVVPE